MVISSASNRASPMLFRFVSFCFLLLVGGLVFIARCQVSSGASGRGIVKLFWTGRSTIVQTWMWGRTWTGLIRTAASLDTGRSELGLALLLVATLLALHFCPALLSADGYIMDVSMWLFQVDLDPTFRYSKNGGKVRTDFVIVDVTLATGQKIVALLSYHVRIYVPMNAILSTSPSGWNRTTTSGASHAGLGLTISIGKTGLMLHDNNNTVILGRDVTAKRIVLQLDKLG
jgi:hypothetical protein